MCICLVVWLSYVYCRLLDHHRPPKKTPRIETSATASTPLLFDRLPHQIHLQTLNQNTPVFRANEPPAQTTQTKKSDTVKIGSSAGMTCLGEYMPLHSIDSLPWEKASIRIKKQKLLSSEISMELDSEDKEPSTASPCPKPTNSA